MLAYDLIGFQTDEDRQNFEDYLLFELGLTADDGTSATEWGLDATRHVPDRHRRRRIRNARRPRRSLGPRSLGCGRVCKAPEADAGCRPAGLFERPGEQAARLRPHVRIEPGSKRAPRVLQVAVPTRGNFRAYDELKAELATLVSEVNGSHGELDWTPIRYLNRGFSQVHPRGILSLGACRPGHAAARRHEPRRQGIRRGAEPVRSGRAGAVLFAGAAKELDAALLVNPHDIDAMARRIARALAMSLEERRERWDRMVSSSGVRGADLVHRFPGNQPWPGGAVAVHIAACYRAAPIVLEHRRQRKAGA